MAIHTADDAILLKRAYEVVRHDDGCPAIGGRGDSDCLCDAVPFLRALEARLAVNTDDLNQGRSTEELTIIGLRCRDVAAVAFPNFIDRERRDRFALALVDLVRAIDGKGSREPLFDVGEPS